MFKNKFLALIILCLTTFGCQNSAVQHQTENASGGLRQISALKLNFRFEPDVPAPSAADHQTLAEEKNAAVQNDFDVNRPQEMLEKTFTSPDKQRVVAAYRIVGDAAVDYRLDMYAADGRLVKKITPNGMAVRFPDTLVWSPDSNNVAFVAVGRLSGAAAANPAAQTSPSADANTSSPQSPNANLEVDTNVNTNVADPASTATTTTAPGTTANILTFPFEQIYLSNKEGADLKPITQNGGLIYFYFVWSPDSSALASLAATWREWQIGQAQAEQRGEIFIPAGRPRLIEKNGRERLLSDNVTTVQPVWSPDSAKIADAFDKEIRIYDAISDQPTQAAIPLRNQLLISSKTYDDQKRRETDNTNTGVANANTNANAGTNANANANAANVNANTSSIPAADSGMLPDESTLVSFNPIIELKWTEDTMLYAQTAYVRAMKNQADSVRSFARWHRLIFSPQASAIN